MARVLATATELKDLAQVSFVVGNLTVATSDKMHFDNNGDVFLIVHNADASAHTFDIIAQNSTDGVVPTDHQESVAAGDYIGVGAYNVPLLNVAGKVQIDWEAGEEEHLYYKLIKFRPL